MNGHLVKLMENPIKMDDLGVPLFLETPISRWLVADGFLKIFPFFPENLAEQLLSTSPEMIPPSRGYLDVPGPGSGWINGDWINGL